MKCHIGNIADKFFQNQGLKYKFSDLRTCLNFGNEERPTT